LLGLLLLSTACEYNKYPDGPQTTIFTANDRVTNEWRWKLALENGENRTGVLRDSILTFTSDQVLTICPRTGEGACTEGEWALVTKRSKLNLIFGNEARAYEILLLSKHEMWLSYVEDGEDIRWELESND
jgi:hypothetical protein